jgi:precorrin-6B methylase 2
MQDAAAQADLEALFARARAARRRRADEARALFEQLLGLAEGTDEAWETVARAHLALLDDNREAAEAALARVGELLPSDPRTAALGMLVADRWPAELRSCETHLVARSRAFRALCRSLPKPGEVALELGAAYGQATRALARRCARVYAVEKSAAMARRTEGATQDLPNVRLIVADVEEPGLIRAQAPHADLIFQDIGGSTPVPKVYDIARRYRELYCPRVLVIRSVYLHDFVADLASVEGRRG